MINHLFLYKGRGSLLILSFTSSTDKWNAALVILAIALSFRSWFPLFRILPQTASWYQTDLSAELALPLKVKQESYRIAQEALHNTVKHAHASEVELRLCQTSEAVILEVCDNGRGFDATASFPGHLGLHSMQERVKGLGGVLQIESAPGQGTRVRAQVPVHETT